MNESWTDSWKFSTSWGNNSNKSIFLATSFLKGLSNWVPSTSFFKGFSKLVWIFAFKVWDNLLVLLIHIFYSYFVVIISSFTYEGKVILDIGTSSIFLIIYSEFFPSGSKNFCSLSFIFNSKEGSSLFRFSSKFLGNYYAI